MLLRSSSNPAFESLLPIYPQSEILSQTSNVESKVALESVRYFSFSGSSSARGSLTSPGVQNLCRREVVSGDEIDRDVDREVTLWPSIEKVQFESDVHSRSLGPISSARVAASSLLCNEKLSPASDENDSGCNLKKPLSRPLTRKTQSPLSSVTSVYFGASGLDRQDFIPEVEVETMPKLAVPGDADSSGRRGDFHRNGIPVDELTQYPDSTSGRVLVVRGGEVGVKRNFLCSSTTAESRASICDARVCDEEDRAGFSVRLEEMRTQRSSPVNVGVKGGSMVCDSRGWRSAPHADDEHSKLLSHGGGRRGGGGRPSDTCTGGSGGSGPGANSDSTDLHYQKMLEENPGHPLFLRNYAQYLAEVKRDYTKAEEYCHRAILANPCDGEMLAYYAKLIWDRQRDYERAASYFERAVQAASDNSYVMAAYACFLWNADEGEQEGG